MSTKIFLYDTTLRDGAQSEDVNLSATDKVRIARQLDYLGMDYIEGGWPGANPVETEFFNAMRGVGLRHAKLAAFGSTHHPSHTPERRQCNARGVLPVFQRPVRRYCLQKGYR